MFKKRVFPLTEATLIRRTKDKNIIGENLEGKVYVVDGEHSYFYSFNETATVIWEICRQPVSMGKLVQEVAKTFEVSEASIRKDIYGFINSYLEKGLFKQC
jgi:hypothetical protein